ncbi:MAG TPA: substrate-binding domain-containing protein [Humibacter sp.]|nr:substrate-binding domain-containing protein [Humibacter sp.]
MRPRIVAVTAVLAALVMLTACSNAVSPNGTVSHPAADPATASIGLLLPDSTNTRYEAEDRPAFEAGVATLCPRCTVRYQNASADASKQQAQAEAMLSQGVSVLVLDAVDGEAAASIVNEAVAQNVPVIAYDRLIDSPDLAYYISFDNREVGVLQARALVNRMRELGAPSGSGILMVNGSPTDNNASLYKQGAHSVLDHSGYRVLNQYDTPDWAGSEAQSWVAGQLTQYGDAVRGIYAANDSLAQGAITAVQGAGISPIPPTTGQDAELAAVQRIVAGIQYMTVYKPMRQQAQQAARLAVDLLNGKRPRGATTVATGGGTVQAFELSPEAVTAENLQSTVIASGFHTAAEICTPSYKAYCTKYGIR